MLGVLVVLYVFMLLAKLCISGVLICVGCHVCEMYDVYGFHLCGR